MEAHALNPISLRHGGGSTATVYAQGAHVTSWVPAGGDDVLFMGSTAEIATGKTIRGGIPVVFPQFAKNGPLPQHGFVRRMPWKVQDTGDPATAVFRITDNEETRGLWPHRFSSELRVSIGDDVLRVELSVTNTDDHAIFFTCALHTYLRVGDLRESQIHGLGGVRFIDKTRSGEQRTQEEDELCIDGEVDRIYLDPPTSLSLVDRSESRRVLVTSSGFENIVVWNPGSARVTEFSGLTADDYLRFVCIEAATAVDRVTLEPGRTWTGGQELRTTSA